MACGYDALPLAAAADAGKGGGGGRCMRVLSGTVAIGPHADALFAFSSGSHTSDGQQLATVCLAALQRYL